MSAKIQQLEALLSPVIEGMGFVCWGIEYLSQGKRSVLRVYIDHPDGIDVDQCARVSHQVSGVLDVEDPIKSQYTLEVSSPGMDRPLFHLEQYSDYVGALVKIRLRMPFEGRRKYQGVISAVVGDEVHLIVDEHELQLPFEAIESARVVPVFE